MMKSSNYSWPRGVLYKCKGTHTKLQVQVSQVKSSAKYKTQHSITYKLSQSRYNSQVCCYGLVQQLNFGELYTFCGLQNAKKVWLKFGQRTMKIRINHTFTTLEPEMNVASPHKNCHIRTLINFYINQSIAVSFHVSIYLFSKMNK